MVEDNDRYIIELHRGMGQLEGQVKALISAVESGFRQTREAQARGMEEVRKVNSDQWEVIERNRADAATAKDTLTKDCTDHRIKQSTRTAITGGGSAGVLVALFEFAKYFWTGQ